MRCGEAAGAAVLVDRAAQQDETACIRLPCLQAQPQRDARLTAPVPAHSGDYPLPHDLSASLQVHVVANAPTTHVLDAMTTS